MRRRREPVQIEGEATVVPEDMGHATEGERGALADLAGVTREADAQPAPEGGEQPQQQTAAEGEASGLSPEKVAEAQAVFVVNVALSAVEKKLPFIRYSANTRKEGVDAIKPLLMKYNLGHPAFAKYKEELGALGFVVTVAWATYQAWELHKQAMTAGVATAAPMAGMEQTTGAAPAQTAQAEPEPSGEKKTARKKR